MKGETAGGALTPLLEARGIVKRYGHVTALDGADFSVHAGEVVALIGVQDLIVVHSGRATLVCPRDRAQDVRRIVERLKLEAPDFL